jgi:hypothetical protein
MYLLGNADVFERGSHIALRLAGNVLPGQAVVDEKLAVVSVSGADSGDLREREMCTVIKGCRQVLYGTAQLFGSQAQQRWRSL